MPINTFSRGLLSHFLILLALSLPGIVSAATESRTALVIGNSAYTSAPLKNPVNDATDMAAILKKLGFTVTLKQNAKQQEMDEAIEAFGNSLKRGGVGLFYYAGHGVQINGTNYLLPIGVRINKEADIKYQAVDANRILDEMANANNGLNIVMLDACRDNPYTRSFRNATRGLAIVSSAPSGTFISYSTSPGNVARDGDGRNSPYTKAVLENIAKPGLTITDVFMNVRINVKRETGQVPWELSSLEGRFYFNEQSGGGREATAEAKRLDDERQRIVQERELLEKQKALDVEKKKLKSLKREQTKPVPPAFKKSVSTVRPFSELSDEEALAIANKDFSSLSDERLQEIIDSGTPKEVKRDGRFIAYNNGTVLDTKTNLMWAAKDNGSNINWANAKSYCKNYRGAGYTDWRMPMQDELAGLYDAGKTYKADCGYDAHLTGLIRLTCPDPWASETRGSEAVYFSFFNGYRYWHPLSYDGSLRALPVRSGR